MFKSLKYFAAKIVIILLSPKNLVETGCKHPSSYQAHRKMVSSSKKTHITDNKEDTYNYVSSSSEFRIKFVSSSIETVTKLPNKKLQYILTILFISGTPVSRDELTNIFSYQNRVYFSQMYLKPLEAAGYKKDKSRKANRFQPKIPDYRTG